MLSTSFNVNSFCSICLVIWQMGGFKQTDFVNCSSDLDVKTWNPKLAGKSAVWYSSFEVKLKVHSKENQTSLVDSKTTNLA